MSTPNTDTPNTATGVMSKAIDRAAYLLDVVYEFMEENPIAAEYTKLYDDAECDGSCLGEDCKSAAAELRFALTKTRGY